jgi:ATP-dependent RNA helicase A
MFLSFFFLATIDVSLFREYFFNCSIIEIEGRTSDVREYFFEDIIQLLYFQPINSTTTNRKNKNRQLQDNDDEQGYEDSQAGDIELFILIFQDSLTDLFF